MKSVAVIGCTGSIGSQTLDVLSRHQDVFDVRLITCFRNISKAKENALIFPNVRIATHDNSQESLFNQDMMVGDQAIIDFIITNHIQIVVIASSSIETTSLVHSILPYVDKVAISSKEVIIVTGSLGLVSSEWKEKVLPVDSEHAAIHQLLRYAERETIQQVVLTASGGPFYSQQPVPDLTHITPSLALKHPTWQMGKKVTIDSATLVNKGIELLEAHYLFDLPPEMLQVVIHPQSIIHAMLQFKDGSTLSQMAYPDMRLPIAYALFYPERTDLPYITPIDTQAFPMCSFVHKQASDIPVVALALECLRESGLSPIWYVLADEIAVEAFLNQKIRFVQIADFLRYSIEKLPTLYSVRSLSIDQKGISIFIHDVRQNIQRLLIQFKKQVA
jgi:1-deoxy-D-xylulose-5-phosphate reductoisomerase